MRAIKAKYAKGKIVLPPGLPEHETCEVTVLFPDDRASGAHPDGERFRRAAGAWSGLDTKALKERVYKARKVSLRS